MESSCDFKILIMCNICIDYASSLWYKQYKDTPQVVQSKLYGTVFNWTSKIKQLFMYKKPVYKKRSKKLLNFQNKCLEV